MNVPDLLRFDPVPLRARHDGWTAGLQRAFVAALAAGMRPGAAAERLGMSRSAAYQLRRRPGAESFAAAWDGALAFARQVRRAARRPPHAGPRPAAPPALPEREAAFREAARNAARNPLNTALRPGTLGRSPKAVEVHKVDKVDGGDRR